ncbi:MAG: glycine cleavage system protein GcvH [Nitrospinaceae bacterium]
MVFDRCLHAPQRYVPSKAPRWGRAKHAFDFIVGGEMEFPKDLLYTMEHEWVRVDGNKVVVGISEFAQDQLGDIVFVELPRVGTTLTRENTFGVVESVKTVSDLCVPVSGTVTAVNPDLEAQPELVNAEPYGKGWMIEIELSDPAETGQLLSPEKYAEQCEKAE